VLAFEGFAAGIIETLGEDNVPAAVLTYLEQWGAQARAAAVGAVPTVSYPASSPWMTAVGGTQLTLGDGNRIVGEAVWNDLQFGVPGNAVGTGGSSRLYRAPWYQPSATQRDRRVVPDIAAMAAVSPAMAIFINGTLQVVGGTSQASPLSAAGSALVSEALTRRGDAPLGFLNPWLYDTVRQDPAMVNDVAAGNNQYPVLYGADSLNVPGCCQAIEGFDAASGLGSLRYPTFLARALS
jgi:kumamolisin